jgi:hypothetical protein
MNFPDMKPRLAVVAIALVLCGTGGCGGTHSSVRAAAHGHDGTIAAGAIVSGPSVVERAGPVPIGDYDGDDYSPGRYNEADNDDSSAPKDRDNDSDNKSGSYYDPDDNTIRHFGHAAGAADARAVTALVKSYFAVAASENGGAACSMIVPSLARSVPESVGQPPGPAYYRGTTCAAVLSKVFKRNQSQLSAYSAQLAVTGVRVDRGSGVAVLGFKTLPGRDIPVARVSGRWTIDALLDDELP